MKKSWIKGNKPWSAEGIRHAQLVGIRKVPKVYNYIGHWTVCSVHDSTSLTVQAALVENDARVKKSNHITVKTYTMLPRYLWIFKWAINRVGFKRIIYKNVLYIDVACARCVGKAISVTRRGVAPAAKVDPNPIKNLWREGIGKAGQKKLASLPSSNEHSNRVGSSLKNSGYNHNYCAKGNSRSSPKSIGEIRWKRQCSKGPYCLYF